MKRNVYANLSQGMDSFLRVAMTLRRKELEVESMSMSTENSGMQLTINDEITSLQDVINYMRKLHDVYDLKVM
ncbi:MAG: ACT domain-containing protein [Terrisporobacter sp.]